jgi:hypothetical protein
MDRHGMQFQELKAADSKETKKNPILDDKGGKRKGNTFNLKKFILYFRILILCITTSLSNQQKRAAIWEAKLKPLSENTRIDSCKR